MIDIPLATCILHLQRYDEFQILAQFISNERDKFIGDLGVALDPYHIMKISGSISALDELYALLKKPPEE